MYLNFGNEFPSSLDFVENVPHDIFVTTQIFANMPHVYLYSDSPVHEDIFAIRVWKFPVICVVNFYKLM